jgi:hypothetical protein
MSGLKVNLWSRTKRIIKLPFRNKFQKCAKNRRVLKKFEIKKKQNYFLQGFEPKKQINHFGFFKGQ